MCPLGERAVLVKFVVLGEFTPWARTLFVAKLPSWSTCFPQQTCRPAIKVPTLQMCCLVAVDAHASLLLFSFNAVVAETRLLSGFDAVIAENYSQLPWSCCLGISRSRPGVSQGSKHLFLGLVFPKMLPAKHFVHRLPAYPRLWQPLVVS